MLLFTSRWKNRGTREKFAKAALPPHRLTRKEHCMGYFRTCPRCGANLDPGELCDCVARKCPFPGHPAISRQKPTETAERKGVYSNDSA